MNNITYAVSVDVNNPIIPYNVYVASVLDSNVRYLEVTLYENGNVIALSNTATATASLVTDNVLVDDGVECTISNSIITVPLEDLQRHGNLDVQVTVTEGTKVLAIPFPIQVRVTPNIAENAQVDENSLGSYAEVVHEIAEARGTYTTLHDAIATKLDNAANAVKTMHITDGEVTEAKLAAALRTKINAKMDADDATVYHVDRTTTNVTYNADNPKIIYVKAIINGQEAVVFTANGNYYQFALCKNGAFLIRELTGGGGSTTYNPWTPAFAGSISAANSNNINIAPSVAAVVSYVANAVSVKENTANKATAINGDNIASTVLFPTIGAVVSYLVANYIGNGSGTVTENNLASALKNSLYRVDNTTENVVYSADNPRTIYTNARVNGDKPTLIFTLGDDSQLAMHKDGHLYCRTFANGAYGSWIDLKAMSIGESNKTSGAYPTVQAVYNFVTAFVASSISGKANAADVNAALNGKENLSNKVPNRAAMDDLNSETQYPSIKTMVQYTDDKALDVLGEVSDVKAYIGYTDDDILGLRADFENKRFTRLAGAADLSAGSDFDGFSMFGGRRRCNVADDGTINAFYGDAGYTEDGTNGQVMVYQPKFYYKVVPLKLEKQSSGLGYHIRKANYYVTETPHAGFKLHPLFRDANGNEVEYVLLSAYEGSLYDVSAGVYINDNAPRDFAYAQGDLLCSVAGKKPVSGRLSGIGSKANLEEMASAHGTGWHLDTIKSVSANQLLMVIEFASFNMQSAIGQGVVAYSANGTYNCACLTGSTAALGNTTGMASETIFENGTTTEVGTVNGKVSVSYRGVENPWGNIWKQIDGINIYGNGHMGSGQAYVAQDFNFREGVHGEQTIGSITYRYAPAGFALANTNSYISAFGYGYDSFDWIFLPTEVNGNTATPIGDQYYGIGNLNGDRIARFGGAFPGTTSAGLFNWTCAESPNGRGNVLGGRLLYVPTAAV